MNRADVWPYKCWTIYCPTKKNRKDYESPRQRFIRETDEILAVVNRESGATVNDKKVLLLFKKKVPAI